LLDLVSITIKNGILFRKPISDGAFPVLNSPRFAQCPAQRLLTVHRQLASGIAAAAQLSNIVSQVLARPSEWLELFKASRQRDAFFFARIGAQQSLRHSLNAPLRATKSAGFVFLLVRRSDSGAAMSPSRSMHRPPTRAGFPIQNLLDLILGGLSCWHQTSSCQVSTPTTRASASRVSSVAVTVLLSILKT
jgi:hypothetical protein